MFWCDGTFRRDYKTFGNVIAFDAAYKCHAYNKPLVVIVGINHHGKAVPFVVALVSDETTETYKWILEQVIQYGEGNIPHTVIIDGEKAMDAAIKIVLPNSHHRLCLWHLMTNIKKNGRKRFDNGFMKCIHKCRTGKEFDDVWHKLVVKYKLREKQWAKDLYNNKGKWRETFMHGQFFAGKNKSELFPSCIFLKFK